MEIGKLKGERKIITDVSRSWFIQMRNAIILDKGTSEGTRAEGECAKKPSFSIFNRG